MIYDFTCFECCNKEWVAQSLVLNGCVGQGLTMIDAIKSLEENEIEWIDEAREYKIEIPKTKEQWYLTAKRGV